MRIHRLAIGGLVGAGMAIVALAVGGAAVAGSPSGMSSAAQSAQTTQNSLAGAEFDQHHGMLGRMLHGEFVLQKAGGGYQTVLVQRGSAQTVNSGSITVRSADGFHQTYVVDSHTLVNAGKAGIGSLAKGHRVGVVATESGNTATAVHVIDLSLLKSGGEKHGMMPHQPR